MRPITRIPVDIGTLKHAIRILKFWADNEGDDPEIREAVMQTVEVARALIRDLRRFSKTPRRRTEP